MNIFIDIETIPEQPEGEAKKRIAETISAPATMTKPETIEQWHNGEGKYAGVKDAAIEDAYRKTSLDAAKGQIVSIAAANNQTDPDSCSGLDESDIIKHSFGLIEDLCMGNHVQLGPYFIGHWIGGFDLKFIFQRCVILGIKPPFELPFYGRHGKDFYCTMQAWAGYRDTISQDNLCRALGIEGKPDDIDGSKVWDFVKAGNIERVAEYNRDDVTKIREIYKRLTFTR